MKDQNGKNHLILNLYRCQILQEKYESIHNKEFYVVNDLGRGPFGTSTNQLKSRRHPKEFQMRLALWRIQ